jgi:hypothetical protein
VKTPPFGSVAEFCQWAIDLIVVMGGELRTAYLVAAALAADPVLAWLDEQ